MELGTLQVIWFFLIGLLFTVYTILDGFDLGIGALFHFVSKNDEERKVLLKSIGPFWDGNEVWLLAGGGALFAAFPNAYATSFSGFYIPMMVLLFALMFRAVSTEFWFYDEKRRRIWAWTFVLGSFLPSLIYGVALGNVIIGVPIDRNYEFIGNILTLFRPYPLSIGLLGLVVILLQGATYISMKTEDPIKSRTTRLINILWYSFIIIFFITLIMTIIYKPDNLNSFVSWIFFIFVLIFWFYYRGCIKYSKYGKSFVIWSLLIVCLWGIVGSIHYPTLITASNDANNALTIMNSSSSARTLETMLIIAIIGMPFVIFYTIFAYKIFKGKHWLKDDGY